MSHVWSDYLGHVIDDKYVLIKLVGESGPVAIYITQHNGTERTAAVRLVPDDVPEAEQLQRSWKIAAGLTHPGLVRAYAAGSAVVGEGPVQYLVSERVDDNVGAVLAERPLTEEETRQVLDSVLPAVLYLHQRKVAHNGIQPGSIAAVGERVKLTTDSLSDENPDFSADIRALGVALVEMMTQQRPLSESDSLIPRLPAPFREIARGFLQNEPKTQWTLTQAMQALSGAEPAPLRVREPEIRNEPELPEIEPKQGLGRTIGIIAAAVVLLLGIVVFRQWQLRSPEVPAASEAARERARIPADTPPAPAPVPAAQPAKGTGSRWAVVAAIYNTHGAAERRAERIKRRWKGEATVFPAKGEGRKYMVIVGSAETKEEAERLRQRGRSEGLPKDAYVTKVTGLR